MGFLGGLGGMQGRRYRVHTFVSRGMPRDQIHCGEI